MRRTVLVLSALAYAGSTYADGVSTQNTQKMLVLSYFKQNSTSPACGPNNLEALSSATFFPSSNEMYIWNAGALSYYRLQNQRAVRLWTATPIAPNGIPGPDARKVSVKNTFTEWFKKDHGMKDLYVINECGSLPKDVRSGPFYNVRVRDVYQGNLTPSGTVQNRKKVASQITIPRDHLYSP